MAFKKATFEVTIAAGQTEGYDDVSLSPSLTTRNAKLERLRITDRTAAFAGGPCFTLSELDNVEDEDWNDTDETVALGNQMFYADMHTHASAFLDGRELFIPRANIVDMLGAAPPFDVRVGQVLIRTRRVRLEVMHAEAGDVYVVDMFYETSGDWRF